MDTATLPNVSRAVIRPTASGQRNRCPQCGKDVMFVARVSFEHRRQIICNVYEDGKWVRTEHYHTWCYKNAGQPHGEPQESDTLRPSNFSFPKKRS